MADIKVGARLSLKDNFSKEIKSAGACTQNFASTAMSAVSKVDKAFSGFKTKLGALGVSLSLGAAGNQIIDIDAQLTRMGMTADASAEQVNRLKQKIFEAAQDPNIKMDPSQIIEAFDVVMTKTGDLQYVEDNIKNIAVALQASGAAGVEIGDVFSEFQKKAFKASEISSLMDDLVKQGDQGEYTFAKFAKTGKAVLSSYSTIGNSVEDVKKLNAVMQVLVADTKNEELAATALDSVIAELSDPKKQEKLGLIGVSVRDSEGNFRDLADIMADVLAVAEKEGNIDFLGEVFGMTSMKAVRAFQNYGKNYKKLTEDLGDTTGALEAKSARMAGTMKANLQNLQTSFLKFADTNLAKPLENLNNLLSYLSEKPERMTSVFNAIKKGVLSIVAIKGVAKVANLVGSISSGLKNFQAGKMEIGFGGGAANGMPVFVTNMGQGGMGAAGGFDMKKIASGGAKQTLGGIMEANSKTFKSGAIQAGALMVITTAVSKTLGAADAIRDINANKNLTDNEKSKAKGGAVGDAVGTVIGTGAGVAAGAWAAGAAGAKLGSMLGTVIAPGIGTAIGGVLGMAGGAIGGFFAGKAGKWIGEKVGGLFGKKDKVIPNSTAVKEHGNQVCNILRIKLGFMSAFNIMDLSEDLLFVFCL
ncbi:MAG: hypothetical protein P1P67_11395 [Treponema phagedenis]|uniref:phage tail tape measure protein n=1 Tax=Treponema phagedenis TaxID=162 RepID=UPI0031340A00